MQTNFSLEEKLINVRKSSYLELDENLIYNLTKLLIHKREISKAIMNGNERNNFLALQDEYNYCDAQIKLLLSL